MLNRVLNLLSAPASLLLALWLTGCASCPGPKAGVLPRRQFDFQRDTFAFANELVWEYGYDDQGHWVSHPRQPPPSYSHHCFVVARSACQFFAHARFDPSLPQTNAATYRALIDRVIARSPDCELPADQRIVIPGYADLRSFSAAHPEWLERECGGAWHSYVQRGHWRMIMPFNRGHQARMAAQLLKEVSAERPAVVHVVRFPQLTINHAVVLYAAKETPDAIQFATYDPNKPDHPAQLTYDRATRTFTFPANDYFQGGRVDVYQVYHGWWY